MPGRLLVEIQQARLEQLRTAQQAILVRPEDCPEASFAVYYEPLEGAGGDFYDVVPVDSHSFGYFVADVSGHGVSAAFLTSAPSTAPPRAPESAVSEPAGGFPTKPDLEGFARPVARRRSQASSSPQLRFERLVSRLVAQLDTTAAVILPELAASFERTRTAMEEFCLPHGPADRLAK